MDWKHLNIGRREALGTAAALGLAAFTYKDVRAAPAFSPAASLLEGAKREGKLVLYTATFTEVMQEVVREFTKKFPFVSVDLVRAPGGQLFTRVRTEAAAGKLAADVVDHSDPPLMKRIEDLFADYAPPNAKDYAKIGHVSPKLWSTITPGWCIAYHSELVKNPPGTWWDLTKPEYGGGLVGQVIAASGGTTMTRIMFERLILGPTYWTKQAAVKPRLFPSGAPLSSSLVQGEVQIAPLIFNIVFPKQRDGAPVKVFYPKEGLPICPYASGIPKTAKNPNAARLFLDWYLSAEGQEYSIKQYGNFTLLTSPPAVPPGFDPKAHKTWVPNYKQMEEVHDKWIAEWNQVYDNRQ